MKPRHPPHSSAIKLSQDSEVSFKLNADVVLVRQQEPFLIGVAGIIALVAYLFVSLIFLDKNVGTDSENFDHWVKTSFSFGASAIDISIMNPMQGMGGLCQPLATRLHLPYLIGFIVCPGNPTGIVTIMSAFLLGLATICFCRALEINWIGSVIIGQTAAIFFFPPMWGLMLRWTHFMSTDLFYSLPATSYPVALGMLFLRLFLLLGRSSNQSNVLITVGMGSTFLYATLVDSLYTAIFWIPVSCFCVGILVGGESKRIILWRLTGGVILIIVCWLLGIFHFYYALFGNAARSVFRNELYVEVQKWDNLTGLFSYGGGSLVFAILILAASGVLIAYGNRQIRWLAASVGVYFVLMIAVSCIYVYSGVRWNLPLPVYLEIGALPVYLSIIGLAVSRGLDLVFSRRWSLRSGSLRIVCVLVIPFICIATLLFINSTAVASGSGMSHLICNESDGLVAKFLVPNVSLNSDGRFRGSVVTVAARPGGEIMRRAGVADSAPFTKEHINFMGRYLRSYDPHLFMTGLWDSGIPTLEDNNHLVTPPYYFLFSRALCRPQDFQSRNWTLCTKVQPNLMAALGAKYLVSDFILDDFRLTRVATQSNPDRIPLHIYEISNSNLGNYSPTQLLEIGDAARIVAAMRAADFPFQDKAIVTSKSGMPLLVAADFGELFFERGGFRVRASSQGWSLLVLPIQFSNSLKIVDRLVSSVDSLPRLLRVNLLQTGVLFHGRIHIKVAHIFGPFRGVAGRIQDIKDWKTLGIKEDGTIPYPPNYQPMAW